MRGAPGVTTSRTREFPFICIFGNPAMRVERIGAPLLFGCLREQTGCRAGTEAGVGDPAGGEDGPGSALGAMLFT